MVNVLPEPVCGCQDDMRRKLNTYEQMPRRKTTRVVYNLAVSKDADVETVDHGHNEVAHGLEHILLLAVHLEHVVQLEFGGLALAE
jgi:hypothetical protein